VRGTAQASSLPDTVSERRVSTNNHDAQYGGAAGMTVNLATKSGINPLHGDLFEYHITILWCVKESAYTPRVTVT
jgi:hypothetical protein